MDSMTRATDPLGRRVMSTRSNLPSRDVPTTVAELRRRLELFSFEHDASTTGSAVQGFTFADLGVRPGGVVEWLTAAPGAGVFTSALQVMSRRWSADGVLAIVDPAGECYAPALTGWGIR